MVTFFVNDATNDPDKSDPLTVMAVKGEVLLKRSCYHLENMSFPSVREPF